jgi:hypothetical protein
MKEIVNRIDRIVGKYSLVISNLDETEFSSKKTQGKWSKKEILGHLIDSAQNNIQRFVRGQYEDTPKIEYAQDEWVRLQQYQQYDKESLIQLWVLLNKHVCRILTAMEPQNYDRQCDTGKAAVELHTLAFIANDYPEHMVHHLNQFEKEIK